MKRTVWNLLMLAIVFALMYSVAIAEESDIDYFSPVMSDNEESINCDEFTAEEIAAWNDPVEWEAARGRHLDGFQIGDTELRTLEKQPYTSFSPDGEQALYLRPSNGKEFYFDDIIVVNTETGAAEVLRIDDLHYSEILKLAWLDDKQNEFSGHANPTMDNYRVYDAKTGAVTREYHGMDFTWDENREHVIYIRHSPHFLPKTGHELILRDDQSIYDSGAENFIKGGLDFSPDGVFYFFEETEEGFLDMTSTIFLVRGGAE